MNEKILLRLEEKERKSKKAAWLFLLSVLLIASSIFILYWYANKQVDKAIQAKQNLNETKTELVLVRDTIRISNEKIIVIKGKSDSLETVISTYHDQIQDFRYNLKLKEKEINEKEIKIDSLNEFYSGLQCRVEDLSAEVEELERKKEMYSEGYNEIVLSRPMVTEEDSAKYYKLLDSLESAKKKLNPNLYKLNKKERTDKNIQNEILDKAHISGIIYDSERNPVPDATVFIDGAYQNKVRTSQKSGYFELLVDKNKNYALTIKSSGYKKTLFQFQCKDQNLKLNIRPLVKDEGEFFVKLMIIDSVTKEAISQLNVEVPGGKTNWKKQKTDDLGIVYLPYNNSPLRLSVRETEHYTGKDLTLQIDSSDFELGIFNKSIELKPKEICKQRKVKMEIKFEDEIILESPDELGKVDSVIHILKHNNNMICNIIMPKISNVSSNQVKINDMRYEFINKYFNVNNIENDRLTRIDSLYTDTKKYYFVKNSVILETLTNDEY